MQDNWNNVQGILEYYGNDKDGFLEVAGPGGWNDPDMLVIGNFGLSYEQSKAQMSLWAVFAAPLIMSNDLRDLRAEYKAILQHREVIKISQDPLGRSGRRVGRTKHVDFFTRPVYPQYRGRFSQAVVVLNRWQEGGLPLAVRFSPHYLGLSDGLYSVTDVWTGDSLGRLTPGQELKLLVPPMGVRLLRFNLVKIIENVNWNAEVRVDSPGETGNT